MKAMAREPFFTTEALKQAVEKISARGPEDMARFLSSEPALQGYMAKIITGSMNSIFQGVTPSCDADLEVMQKAEKELQYTCVKSFMLAREMCASAWAQDLAKQLGLPAKEE